MGLLQDFSRDTANVVEAVSPAVLRVRTLQPGRNRLGGGSGFLVTPDGYALTNSHVVRGATAVEAELADGTTRLADVVGDDPATDLAVLRVETGHAGAFLELSDSNELRVGEVVLAIGSPFGLARTVTLGIVSALGRTLGPGGSSGGPPGGRTIEGVIQTDALLNPGNSGGPLTNAAGGTVGINTAVHLGGPGICFAIPANTGAHVLSEILRHGRVRRAFLGIGVEEVLLPGSTARSLGLEPRGVAVRSVVSGGPAARAGLRPGDVLVALGHDEVRTVSDLLRLLNGEVLGSRLRLAFVRDGELVERFAFPVEADGRVR